MCLIAEAGRGPTGAGVTEVVSTMGESAFASAHALRVHSRIKKECHSRLMIKPKKQRMRSSII